MVRGRRTDPKAIEHGTRRGFQQHKAVGSVPCTHCRQASAAYNHQWYLEHRKAASTS